MLPQSGSYLLFNSATQESRRPLGASPVGEGPNRDIVVLPLGSQPPQWRLRKTDNTYELVLDGRAATTLGDSKLVLTHSRVFPLPWELVTVVGAPPDTYKITGEGPPVFSWFIGTEGSPEVAVPVTVARKASPIFFVRA